MHLAFKLPVNLTGTDIKLTFNQVTVGFTGVNYFLIVKFLIFIRTLGLILAQNCKNNPSLSRKVCEFC